jgi:EAL domain-containing protein (putative c-di-GMP-specific phosphodiesterase class I)
VLPGDFLPVAEESGLTLPIGRYVLDEACRQLAVWRAIGSAPPDLRMSVNVSSRHFWHRSLLDGLDDCLDDAGLKPGSLALEITESALMRNRDLAADRLHELHARGIEVHVDDFGTGYSSLEALYDLPLDALKIDGSFVVRLGSDRRCADLVRTIAQLGANLGLAIIAEGVETGEQRDLIDRLATTYGQGHWFSPPVPGEQAERLLRGARRLPVAS